MALSDDQIEETLRSAGGRWQDESFWVVEDADLHPFARAIEAEVRKQDDALIRQCMEALECAGAYTALIDDISLSAIQEAYKAARARLESKP